MDRHQITLVRDSFALVAPIATQAATLFYGKLFEAEPTLRSLFKGDMPHQGERLMTMVGKAVGLLEQPEVLLPLLRSLGKRHVAYGVVDAHYGTVGQALLETLGEGLGEAFTRPVREAWCSCYGVIAATMQAGAEEARAEALAVAA